MEGEESSSKRLMWGLIGIGIAIVIAVGFVVLAIVGPNMFAGRQAKVQVAEYEGKIAGLEQQLQAARDAVSEQQNIVATKEREIGRLQDKIDDLEKEAEKEEEPPENVTQPEEVPVPTLDINDITTLTKQNCNEAIALAYRNESLHHNITVNLSDELGQLRDLRDNITEELANNTGNLTASRKTDLEDQLEDVEQDIDEVKDDIDIADQQEEDALDRRKRVVYHCNKLLAT